MDQNKLRTLVFEKTGIRIDTMDPVFALVALNEAVLEDSVTQQAAVINAAADRLSEQADRLLEASDRYTQLLQRVEEVAGTEDGANRIAASAAVDDIKPDHVAVSSENLWQKHSSSVVIALATAILTVVILWATGFRNQAVPPKAQTQENTSAQAASEKAKRNIEAAEIAINVKKYTLTIYL